MIFELRPYQSDSIESLRNGFKHGHKRQVLAASTGAGKSIISLSILDAARKKGSKVMFVCDRRVLVDQFSRHLDKHGIDHGCYMAKHWRYRPQEAVQVASIQTIEKMGAWPAVDLIIVDEIHACMRKSLKDFMTHNPEVKVLGLTATPFHAEMGKYFTSVTNVITMEQLVKDGFLVPFRVFVATEIDTSGVKVMNTGEWQQDQLEERGLSIVGDVVADYIRISEEVFGGHRKTIAFSSGVAHGTELVNRFVEAGINAVQISYKDDEEYKRQVLEDFAKPDTDIKIIVSSDILTRGFDQTDVEHVIIAKPLRKAFSMHVQMVGRGARMHEGKKFCVIQDNAGNWLRFQEDWDIIYNEGTKELDSGLDAKTRKEKTEKEKEASKCPKCKHLWSVGTDTCLHCGYIRQKRSIVESLPGMMEEITPGSKYTMKDKQEWWSMAKYMEKNHGWQHARCLAVYKTRFGVWPKGLTDAPMRPSKEFDREITRSLIAYKKGKGRR